MKTWVPSELYGSHGRVTIESHTLKKILPGILGCCCLDLLEGISLHISGDLWVNLIYLVGRWDEGEEAVGCLVLGRSLLFRLEDRAKLRAWQLLKVSIARECQATKQNSQKKETKRRF